MDDRWACQQLQCLLTHSLSSSTRLLISTACCRVVKYHILDCSQQTIKPQPCPLTHSLRGKRGFFLGDACGAPGSFCYDALSERKRSENTLFTSVCYASCFPWSLLGLCSLAEILCYHILFVFVCCQGYIIQMDGNIQQSHVPTKPSLTFLETRDHSWTKMWSGAAK